MPGGGGGQYSDRIRGSTDIRAFADYTIFMEKKKEEIIVIHDKSRWSEPVPEFTISFSGNEINNGFRVAYQGEFKTADTRTIWAWIENTLDSIDSMSRKDLHDLVQKGGPCSPRALDDHLKKHVKKGNLKKQMDGREVIYSWVDHLALMAVSQTEK